jgi:signal transduction histidine kinase
MVFLAWFLYDRIASHILGGVETELIRQTTAVRETLGRNPDRSDLIASFIESEIAAADPALRLAIELFDADGTSWLRRDILAPFSEPLPAGRPRGPGESLFYEVDRNDEYPFFVMVVPNSHGFTRAALYGGPFLRRTEEIRTLFLLAMPVGLLLTGLLGWWLARRSLRPIAEITETAQRMRAAPSGESIPVTGSGDELDRLAVTLNEMLERIRRYMDRMRRFSADAAHELRTPLSVLKTRLEVTLEKERTAPEYRRALAETLADIELLGDGVYAILRLADSEAGLDPDRSEPVPLERLLQSVVDFFEPLARENGILLAPPPSQDPTLWGDPVWLHTLFSNLIDNAIKYSRRGDSIELEVTEEAGFVAVSVHDTGIGIDPAERERVFEHFFRGGEHHSSRGIGLGLPLALEIARAHGGSIELQSRARGTSFTVRLSTRPVSHG